MSSNMRDSSNSVSLWLFINAFMVLLMVVIGGLTRLTDSGLSMTDWNFFSGIIPPITENDWVLLFNEYKKYPEYKLINFGMNISEFKVIFFWEYLHRIWGRLIGLTFLIPFIYFALKKMITKKLFVILCLILSLGCFQGFMGWYMVSSGLVDKPDVSQYRLASHLGIAFLIYSSLIFLGWNLWAKFNLKFDNRYLKIPMTGFYFCFILLFITIISGAFVSGTKAGLSYNSFPLMGEELIPGEIFDLSPLWKNFFENTSLIQLNHRILATFTCIAILVTSLIYLMRYKDYSITNRILLLGISIAIILQYSLGILALINYVPIYLGLIHQLGGLLNLTLITLIISQNSIKHEIKSHVLSNFRTH